MQHEPTNSTNEAEEINEVTEVWSDGGTYKVISNPAWLHM